MEVAIILAVAALLAGATFTVTRRMKLWLRIALTLIVFSIVVLPIIIGLVARDEPLDGARTVTPEEVANPQPTTGGGK